MKLSVDRHDRDSAGLSYVYPVVSRRAQGVSIGINLNPNRACNWRCIYCQVPGLSRGAGPEIDLERLRRELAGMLDDVLEGDFFEREVPEDWRRLNDVAISGDGEPTTSPQLLEAIEIAAGELERRGLVPEVKLILITNGSLVHTERVQRALARMTATGAASVWFKLDSATDAGISAVNDATMSAERSLANLRTCAGLAPTWVQTCFFALHGAPPEESEVRAWLDAIARLVEEGVPLEGILLYGIARASHQPEGPTLGRLSRDWMEAVASRARSLGVEVRVHL